jgi:sugar/nucleoside kinase (ribokinase family)
LGGNGANTSSAIARLGVESRLLGMTGGDAFGETCRQMMTAHGVELSGVGYGEAATATSIVLIQSSGARTFLHRPGSSREVFAGGLEVPGDAAHYHLANVFALPNLREKAPAVLASARARGLSTSLDTAWDARDEWMKVLEPCLPHLDILFVNEDEARMLSGSVDPKLNAEFFLSRGARMLVMKRGPAGCDVFTSGEHVHAPAYAVDAVDTTGAGDCFAGAFLAARARGYELRDAASLANAVGGMVVEQLGATTGLRGWDETLAWQRVHAVIAS